jgi:hypothetical protein
MPLTTWSERGCWQSLKTNPSTQCLRPLFVYDPTGKQKKPYSALCLDTSNYGGEVLSTPYDLLKWNLSLHKNYTVLPKELYAIFTELHSKGPIDEGGGILISQQTRYGPAYCYSDKGNVFFMYIPSQELSFIALFHTTQDKIIIKGLIHTGITDLLAEGVVEEKAKIQAINEISNKYPEKDTGWNAFISLFIKRITLKTPNNHSENIKAN